jgi:hypothetical protein
MFVLGAASATSLLGMGAALLGRVMGQFGSPFRYAIAAVPLQCRIYLFRNEYIFEVEKAVVVETHNWATPPTYLPDPGAWTAFSPCTPGSRRTTFGAIAIMQRSG